MEIQVVAHWIKSSSLVGCIPCVKGQSQYIYYFSFLHFFQIMLTFNCLFLIIFIFLFWIFQNFSLFSQCTIIQSLYNEVQCLPCYIISTCFCAMYDWKFNFWLHHVMSYWEESALSLVFFSLTVTEEVRKIVFLTKN